MHVGKKVFLLTLILFLVTQSIGGFYLTEVPANSQVLTGVVIKNNTPVYSSQNTNSTKLRTYPEGHILKYRQINSKWLDVEIYHNGKYVRGYIPASNVEVFQRSSKVLQGVAKNKTVNVYERLSKSSKVLRTYSEGHIIKFKKVTTNWFDVEIYHNGKYVRGYIHKDDVYQLNTTGPVLQGVPKNGKVQAYSTLSKNSTVLREYNEGHIIKFKQVTPDWYDIEIFHNGKYVRAYIYKNDVELLNSNGPVLRGIALKNPTNVYSSLSKNSKVIRQYTSGYIITHKQVTSKWLDVTIEIQGKSTKGYIPIEDVERLTPSNKVEQGIALKDSTPVYEKMSKDSKVLKTYPKGHVFRFKQMSPNWNHISFYVNGKLTDGYLHRSDVNITATNVTTYNYDLKKMVDAQLKANPQTDLTGGLGWQTASRNQVEYYTNPLNFQPNTPAYYQFLRNDYSLGLTKSDIDIINRDFLNRNAGVFNGKAQVFAEAAQANGINEIYLIAHAFLETKRGTSKLANGVNEWTKRDKNGNIVTDENGDPVTIKLEGGKKVYNMFGIGAKDKCPIDCGAQTAYDNGWFSVDEAIKGGAKFATEKYIFAGQDTLYKMRWNPKHLESSNYASHQYATDVGWAVKQGQFFYDILNKTTGTYPLIFDVPQFKNQKDAPKGSTQWIPPEITYPEGVLGITDSGNSNLNMRQNPTTSSSIIASIPSGSTIEVLGETIGQKVSSNSVWYKVKYNGKIGWVSSNYVDLINLLEVKVSNKLNVRNGAGTANANIGSFTNGALIVAVVNENNELVTKSADGHIWYQIYYKDGTAWISGGKDGTEYITIK